MAVTNSSSGVPAGTMVDYGGGTVPAGWLLCYGQAVSRTTYAALFLAIGTAHGAGDGATTFNLPDARGRVIAGKDNMGGSAANRLTSGGAGVDGAALGAVGGSQTHTLTEAQLASHAHSGAVNAYYVGTTGNTAYSSDFRVTSTTTGTAGSGSAHQNTQPTLIANKMIKV